MTWLLVALGAAVGAPLRYAVDHAVRGDGHRIGPYGTWVVNAVASLLLGVVMGVSQARDLPGWGLPLVGGGFCGALSTWSTLAWESIRLVELRSAAVAVANVCANLVAGLALAWAGWHVAVWLA